MVEQTEMAMKSRQPQDVGGAGDCPEPVPRSAAADAETRSHSQHWRSWRHEDDYLAKLR
jgi:hypothetical protein